MEIHPKRSAFSEQISRCLDEIAAPFSGSVARCCKPKYSSSADLFSGKGALHSGSRWMLKGIAPLVYASIELETAFAEALATSRYFGFPEMAAAPILMVSADCEFQRIVDLRDGDTRGLLSVAEDLSTGSNRRSENRQGREATTQALGWTFADPGIEAVIVPSAAKPDGANIICFPRNFTPGSHLSLEKEIEWPDP